MISDGKARRLASEWHGGQWTAIYSFASSGAISPGLLTEINREITDETDRQQLATYVFAHGYRDLVPGWSNLWE